MAETQDIVLFAFRWLHFLAGITWIGLLYFFNLVNVPAVKVIDASARPHVTTTILPRALWWFRHGAWVTVVAGLILIYMKYWANGPIIGMQPANYPANTIGTGALLGLIMLFNVWMIIWPNQRKVINATAAKEAPDPSWGRMALYASRTNFILSFPMLLFMGGASHYPLDWVGIVVWGLIAAAIGALIVFWVQKAWIFTPKPAAATPVPPTPAPTDTPTPA